MLDTYYRSTALNLEAAREAKTQIQARRRDHVVELAAQHQVEVRLDYRGGRGAVAYRKEGYIRLPALVGTPNQYAMAMHELGHLAGPWQGLGRMDQEVGAWIWALDWREPDLWTKSATTKMIRALSGYSRRLKPGTKTTALQQLLTIKRLPRPTYSAKVPTWVLTS